MHSHENLLISRMENFLFFSYFFFHFQSKVEISTFHKMLPYLVHRYLTQITELNQNCTVMEPITNNKQSFEPLKVRHISSKCQNARTKNEEKE